MKLRYCYHAARAIIENRNVLLTDDDPEMLLADNPKAGTLIRDNFKGFKHIADFGSGIAGYFRERAVFMEATTIERISFASLLLGIKMIPKNLTGNGRAC